MFPVRLLLHDCVSVRVYVCMYVQCIGCVVRGNGKKKKVSVVTALVCSDDPATFSAVPFMRVAPCLLLLLFFPSLNNDRRNKRHPVPWTIGTVARVNPRRCRLIISIADREWRRLSDERDFPSGGDTVSSTLFYFSVSFLDDEGNLFLPRVITLPSSAIRTLIITHASN